MQYLLYLEFTFKQFADKKYAFANMGRKQVFEEGMNGLRFLKAMGTGAGNGFSAIPDFSRYAFIMLFESKDAAEKSLKNNPVFQRYFSRADHFLKCHLLPVMVHGTWGGVQPFDVEGKATPEDSVAVITRARINTAKIFEFWWNVSEAGNFMKSRKEAIYQVGIGEYPIFMQATFSMWESMDAMKKAAYNGTPHAEIVKKTRERNWYAEEMFSVFKYDVLALRGSRYRNIQKQLTHL